jgi:acyl-CoA thioesterase I
LIRYHQFYLLHFYYSLFIAFFLKTKNILCFGDSLTAGYGLSSSQAYPALIQQFINQLRLPYHVINAGRNGDTSAGGVQRIEQYIHQPIDVFLLELGVNDLPRGILPAQTDANLQRIIDRVRQVHPRTRMVLAGMDIPPAIIPPGLSAFLEVSVIRAFSSLFAEVASRNNMAYIPFLLKDVAGIPHLNQWDRIHPTAAGQQIIARNVWDVLSALL